MLPLISGIDIQARPPSLNTIPSSCSEIFSTFSVNTSGSDPHVDGGDKGVCCILPTGQYTSAKLVFPGMHIVRHYCIATHVFNAYCLDLKIQIDLQPGDAALFRSALLVHWNSAIEGQRDSLVLYLDSLVLTSPTPLSTAAVKECILRRASKSIYKRACVM